MLSGCRLQKSGSAPGSTPSSMLEATRPTLPKLSSNILVTGPGSVEYPKEPIVKPTASTAGHVWGDFPILRTSASDRMNATYRARSTRILLLAVSLNRISLGFDWVRITDPTRSRFVKRQFEVPGALRCVSHRGVTSPPAQHRLNRGERGTSGRDPIAPELRRLLHRDESRFLWRPPNRQWPSGSHPVHWRVGRGHVMSCQGKQLLQPQAHPSARTAEAGQSTRLRRLFGREPRPLPPPAPSWHSTTSPSVRLGGRLGQAF